MDQGVSHGMTLVIVIILARELSPEDFGLINMAMIVIGFGNLFSDLGFGNAVVQAKELTNEKLSTIFWFNVVVSSVIAVLVYFGSSYISSFFENDRLESVLQIMSVAFFLIALSTVQMAIVRRALNFKVLFIYRASAIFISGAVAIFLAVAGYGVLSLVAQVLLNWTILALFFWVKSTWKPEFVFNKSDLTETLKFGLPLFGTNVLNYWMRNLDNLLIGKFLGSAPLGVYGQSYRLVIGPTRKISLVINNVLFPTLSKVQDDLEYLKKIFLKAQGFMITVVAPLLMIVFGFAESFVRVLLGEKWLEAVPVVEALAIVGAVQVIGAVNTNVYMATGRTGYQFKVGIFPRVLTIAALIVGVSYGIVEVAWFYLAAVSFNFFYALFFVKRVVPIAWAEYWRNLWFGFVAAAGIALLARAMQTSSFYAEIPEFIGLTCASFFLAALLITGIWVFRREYLKPVVAVIQKKFKQKR